MLQNRRAVQLQQMLVDLYPRPNGALVWVVRVLHSNRIMV